MWNIVVYMAHLKLAYQIFAYILYNLHPGLRGWGGGVRAQPYIRIAWSHYVLIFYNVVWLCGGETTYCVMGNQHIKRQPVSRKADQKEGRKADQKEGRKAGRQEYRMVADRLIKLKVFFPARFFAYKGNKSFAKRYSLMTTTRWLSYKSDVWVLAIKYFKKFFKKVLTRQKGCDTIWP